MAWYDEERNWELIDHPAGKTPEPSTTPENRGPQFNPPPSPFDWKLSEPLQYNPQWNTGPQSSTVQSAPPAWNAPFQVGHGYYGAPQSNPPSYQQSGYQYAPTQPEPTGGRAQMAALMAPSLGGVANWFTHAASDVGNWFGQAFGGAQPSTAQQQALEQSANPWTQQVAQANFNPQPSAWLGDMGVGQQPWYGVGEKLMAEAGRELPRGLGALAGGATAGLTGQDVGAGFRAGREAGNRLATSLLADVAPVTNVMMQSAAPDFSRGLSPFTTPEQVQADAQAARQAWDAGATNTARDQAAFKNIYDRVMAGEDPRAVLDSIPPNEASEQLFDMLSSLTEAYPLNIALKPLGEALQARQLAKAAAAARPVVATSAEALARAAQTGEQLASEGAAATWKDVVNPTKWLQPTNPSRAHAIANETQDVVGQALNSAIQTLDAAHADPNIAALHQGTGDLIDRALQRQSAGLTPEQAHQSLLADVVHTLATDPAKLDADLGLGGLPLTEQGVRSQALIQRLAGVEPTAPQSGLAGTTQPATLKPDAPILKAIREAKTPDEAVQKLIEATSSAAGAAPKVKAGEIVPGSGGFFPTPKPPALLVGPAKVQKALNSVLGAAYMGLSGGYGVRNFVNNALTATVDHGLGVLADIGGDNAFMREFRAGPLGPSGRNRGFSLPSATGAGGRKVLPGFILGEKGEQGVSRGIYDHTAKQVFPRLMQQAVTDGTLDTSTVRGILSDGTISLLAQQRGERGVYGLLGKYLGGKVKVDPDPAILNELHTVSPEAAMAYERALTSGTTKPIDDYLVTLGRKNGKVQQAADHLSGAKQAADEATTVNDAAQGAPKDFARKMEYWNKRYQAQEAAHIKATTEAQQAAEQAAEKLGRGADWIADARQRAGNAQNEMWADITAHRQPALDARQVALEKRGEWSAAGPLWDDYFKYREPRFSQGTTDQVAIWKQAQRDIENGKPFTPPAEPTAPQPAPGPQTPPASPTSPVVRPESPAGPPPPAGPEATGTVPGAAPLSTTTTAPGQIQDYLNAIGPKYDAAKLANIVNRKGEYIRDLAWKAHIGIGDKVPRTAQEWAAIPADARQYWSDYLDARAANKGRSVPSFPKYGTQGKLTEAPAVAASAIPERELAQRLGITTRKDMQPTVSFDEYVAQRGYKPTDLPNEYERVGTLGTALLPNLTRSGRGKLSGGVRKMALEKQLLNDYRAAIESGEIKQVAVETPLDFSKGADRAYVRTRQKRAERNAAVNVPLSAEQTAAEAGVVTDAQADFNARLRAEIAKKEALHREAVTQTHSSVRVADLKVDPDRFQYKLGTGPEGITPSMSKITHWNPALGAGISVWVDPADGLTYVVNGHHRVALAKRLGVESIDAPVYLQADTAAQARAIGAIQNIGNRSGTVFDAAKYFRDNGATAETLAGEGLNLSEGMVRDGMALAQLHPSLFNAAVRGELPLRRAVIIGERLPDQSLQFNFVQQLDRWAKSGRKITDDVVAELADQVASGPKEVATQTDMFGAFEQANTHVFERAELAAYVRTQLAQDKKLFGLAAKHAEELNRVGAIDKAAAAGVSSEAAQLMELFDRVKNQRGPISDALNEAATQLGQKGANAAQIKETLYGRITAELPAAITGRLESNLARGAEVGRAGPTATGPGPATQAGLFGETAGAQAAAPEVRPPAAPAATGAPTYNLSDVAQNKLNQAIESGLVPAAATDDIMATWTAIARVGDQSSAGAMTEALRYHSGKNTLESEIARLQDLRENMSITASPGEQADVIRQGYRLRTIKGYRDELLAAKRPQSPPAPPPPMSERGVTGRPSRTVQEPLGGGFGESRVQPLMAKARAMAGPDATIAESISDAAQMKTDAVRAALTRAREQITTAPIAPGQLTPAQQQTVTTWIKKTLLPTLNRNKTITDQVATAARDFALHNYGDKRNIDVLLAQFFPYVYWQTRTMPKWALRFAERPGLLNSYLAYRRLLDNINQKQPAFYRQNIDLGPLLGLNTPLYTNLEQTLNPLYALVSNFNDKDKNNTQLGAALQWASNHGASPWTPAIWAYALARSMQGHPDEASSWVGYLGSPTKAFKSATALLGANGGQGVTLEPNLWPAGQPFKGFDKYDQARIPLTLTAMQQRGDITPEEAVQAAHDKSGPLWDRAAAEVMQGAPGQPMQGRAVPSLVSWGLGAGFKGRSEQDVQLLQAQDEWYKLMGQRQAMTPDQFSAALNTFKAQYPFYETYQLGQKGDQATADSALAWNVLNRLPPLAAGRKLREGVGLTPAMLDTFYQNKGDLTAMKDTDRARFMAGIQDLARQIDIPTPAVKQQYQQVKDLNSALYDLRDTQFPGVDALETQYRALPQGSQARKDLLKANPVLKQWWDAKAAYKQQHPELAAASATATATAPANPEAEFWTGITQRFGQDVQDRSKKYFALKDNQGSIAARNYLAANSDLPAYWAAVREFYGKQATTGGASNWFSGKAPEKVNWSGHGEGHYTHQRGGKGGGSYKKKTATAYPPSNAWKFGPINWKYGQLRDRG